MKEKRFYFSSDISEIIENDETAPTQLEDGQTYKVKIPIFREGKFKHPWYGDLDFTYEYLQKLKRNFQSNIYPQKVSFDIDHKPANGAIAWLEDKESITIEKVKFKTPTGTKTKWVLFADAELNQRGYKLIKNKEYRYFSSEIHPNFTTGEVEMVYTKDGETEAIVEYGPTLVGGGITNRPFIPHLGEIGLSQSVASNSYSRIEDNDGIEGCSFLFASYMEDSNVFAEDDMTPPKGAREEAQRGLDYRSEYKRGGTPVGIARARDLSNGKSLSPSTIRRMKAFFDRHEKNRVPPTKKTESDGGPTNGWIAWLLWGGDSGRSWAEKKVAQMERKKMSVSSQSEDQDVLTFKAVKKIKFEEIVEQVQRDREVSPVEKTFTDSNEGETKMKFSEVLAHVKTIGSANEQVAYLKSVRHQFSSGDEQLLIEDLVATKEAAIIALSERDEAIQRKFAAEFEAKQNIELAVKLRNDLAEAKEGTWRQRVQTYCVELRQEGHHEAVVKTVESLLSGLKKEDREIKFSVASNDEAKSFDIIGFLTEVFSSMPSTAKLDQSELTAANEHVEVAPVAFAQTETVVEEKKDENEIPESVQKFSARNGYMLDRAMWDMVDDQGFLKFD
jgi:hypothetical protein